MSDELPPAAPSDERHWWGLFGEDGRLIEVRRDRIALPRHPGKVARVTITNPREAAFCECGADIRGTGLRLPESDGVCVLVCKQCFSEKMPYSNGGSDAR